VFLIPKLLVLFQSLPSKTNKFLFNFLCLAFNAHRNYNILFKNTFILIECMEFCVYFCMQDNLQEFFKNTFCLNRMY